MGPVGDIGARGEKGDKGGTRGVVNKDLSVHDVVQVQEVCKVLKGYVELLVSKVLLECKDLLVQLAYKAKVDQKGTMILNVLLENKAIVLNEVYVMNEVKSALKVTLQMF